MSSRLEEILTSLRDNRCTLDEACRAVAAAVRQSPTGTRMWPMIIDSRVTQGKLTSAAARALTDAMESYEPEKTMWLAPSSLASNAAQSSQQPSNQSAATQPIDSVSASSASDTLRTTAHDKQADAPRQFDDMEQLRAYLWDSPTQSLDTPQAAAATDERAAEIEIAPQPVHAPPPRPRPGITPVVPAVELDTLIGNRYRLNAHLGYGGIGQIFSATDEELEKLGEDARVTVKLIAVDLKQEPQALSALQKAVARAETLHHPNIVRTFGIEQDGNKVFIVMEPLRGMWLGDRIRQVRKVGMAQNVAWPIVEGIANGLAYAHSHGVIHSDLSPYAVFVAADGTPKIMGFGLIHAVPTSNEAMDLLDTMTLRAYSEAYTADTWGTHAVPQPSDDLYPLGVIAYELLTGTHPFGRHSLTTARQKHLAYAPIPNLPPRAAKLLDRCLSFERTERPKNATRFIKKMHAPALLRWLSTIAQPG